MSAADVFAFNVCVLSVSAFTVTCCINKTIINFTTEGMHYVGQDEIIILLELNDAKTLPKDIFLHLNDIYRDADKGNISR